MKAREYTCACCKGVFESGWTEEEALAEYADNFPKSKEAGEEMDVVCDDCYNQMMGIIPPAEHEKTHFDEN